MVSFPLLLWFMVYGVDQIIFMSLYENFVKITGRKLLSRNGELNFTYVCTVKQHDTRWFKYDRD